MPVKRTITINFLREYVNKQLSLEINSEDYRMALCLLIEQVLLTTAQYKGFQFYDWRHGGRDKWIQDGSPTDTKQQYLGPEYKRIYY